jgi:DMSO/TMAO reductase YedYZ molybdopterin-dependent catalytic subunit
VDAHALEPYRQDLVAPLHCVTTWSVDGLRWSGFPLRQVWALASAAWPAAPDPGGWVMLRGQDGYRTLLPLTDLLAEGVLLADRLEGRPLPVEHGAPWRLVAPAHYGYKQVKHLARLTWCAEVPAQWGSGWRFMDHPRARVALEERGQGWPGWLLRRLYRPLIAPTVWHFARRARHAPVAARKEEAS